METRKPWAQLSREEILEDMREVFRQARAVECAVSVSTEGKRITGVCLVFPATPEAAQTVREFLTTPEQDAEKMMAQLERELQDSIPREFGASRSNERPGPPASTNARRRW